MKRVALGLSGGVDSAVSAMLLLEQGFEVTGATMSFWDGRPVEPDWPHHGCFGPHESANLAAAERICHELGIPHLIVRLQREFASCVLDYFCATYRQGRTPNPCLRCNPLVKFGAFPRGLEDLGAEFDFLATGHYARKQWSEDHQRWQLLAAADPVKDQSYFLAFLSQEQLARALFPLGELSKAEVRRIALRRGLDWLEQREESQDFLDGDVYPRLFPAEAFEPGEIVDPEGRVIGRHRGLPHYTVGQRRHIGISGKSEPWFVTAIDAAANRVIVGPKALLYQDRLLAEQVNWLSVPPPKREINAAAKIRAAHRPASCLLRPLSGDTVEVVFDEPQLAIAPGQGAVFYDGEILLGGGFIR